MRDSVFKNQKECISGGMPVIESLAAGAGIEMGSFGSCMAGNASREELDKYIRQGKDSHIYATPTFFVNGKPIVGPRPIGDFDRALGGQ